MASELIYTSAERGLKPRSHGFCTVAMTYGMPVNLVERLESLSGYRTYYPANDPRAAQNPVNFSYYRFTIGGKLYPVLSRICFAGFDHTGRSNKLAHHLVLEVGELRADGPTWLALQRATFRESWSGEPQLLAQPHVLSAPVRPSRPAHLWKKLTGDAGWAGVVAEHTLAKPTAPVAIVCPAELGSHDLLSLLDESMALIPPQRRWEITFSTYLTDMPTGTTCQWRCLLPESAEWEKVRRNPSILIVDLTSQMGEAKGAELVNSARMGVTPNSERWSRGQSGQQTQIEKDSLAPVPYAVGPHQVVHILDAHPVRSNPTSSDAGADDHRPLRPLLLLMLLVLVVAMSTGVLVLRTWSNNSSGRLNGDTLDASVGPFQKRATVARAIEAATKPVATMPATAPVVIERPATPDDENQSRAAATPSQAPVSPPIREKAAVTGAADTDALSPPRNSRDGSATEPGAPDLPATAHLPPSIRPAEPKPELKPIPLKAVNDRRVPAALWAVWKRENAIGVLTTSKWPVEPTRLNFQPKSGHDVRQFRPIVSKLAIVDATGRIQFVMSWTHDDVLRASAELAVLTISADRGLEIEISETRSSKDRSALLLLLHNFEWAMMDGKDEVARFRFHCCADVEKALPEAKVKSDEKQREFEAQRGEENNLRENLQKEQGRLKIDRDRFEAASSERAPNQQKVEAERRSVEARQNEIRRFEADLKTLEQKTKDAEREATIAQREFTDLEALIKACNDEYTKARVDLNE